VNVVTDSRSVELFEQAMEALDHDGPATAEQALRWLLEAAELGHVDAAYNAAVILRARNANDDLANAVRLLERASAADLDEATIMLGAALILGEGVARDLPRARGLLEPLAARGDSDAQFQMSCLLRETGEPQEALDWEVLAAERGNADACINLAARYAAGLGGPPDPEHTIALLELAAESGSAEAAARLCAYFVAHPALKRAPDEDQRWYERATELGYDFDLTSR
jgi:TPR repeat protein